MPHFHFSVYLPRRSGCTVFKEALDQLEAALLLLPRGVDIIVMGNFNAESLGHLGGPMSCTQLNEQGRILHRYLTKWSFISTLLHLQKPIFPRTHIVIHH